MKFDAFFYTAIHPCSTLFSLFLSTFGRREPCCIVCSSEERPRDRHLPPNLEDMHDLLGKIEAFVQDRNPIDAVSAIKVYVEHLNFYSNYKQWRCRAIIDLLHTMMIVWELVGKLRLNRQARHANKECYAFGAWLRDTWIPRAGRYSDLFETVLRPEWEARASYFMARSGSNYDRRLLAERRVTYWLESYLLPSSYFNNLYSRYELGPPRTVDFWNTQGQVRARTETPMEILGRAQ